MVNILILGGGFGGVVTAEMLGERLANTQHKVMMVSRSRNFIFYPSLIDLAFGKAESKNITFDLQKEMFLHRVNFIEGEITHVDFDEKEAIIGKGDISGAIRYDYLIVALGRRLATEKNRGYFEFSRHLLSPKDAINFGAAIRNFKGGKIILGLCPDGRLPVPVFESAFAISNYFEKNKPEGEVEISIVLPESLNQLFGGFEIGPGLRNTLEKRGIGLIENFPIKEIAADHIESESGDKLPCNLSMLIPSFRGPSVITDDELLDEDGFFLTDKYMRVKGMEGVYAVGDCVSFSGPKMGHLAIREASAAAVNLIDELNGRPPSHEYEHQIRLVIDAGKSDSIYIYKNMQKDDPPIIRQGRFWSWAKHFQHGAWQAGRFSFMSRVLEADEKQGEESSNASA